MQPTESGIKTWQWVVTVIVIIVLIIIGVMVFGNKGSQAPATTAPVSTATSTSQSGSVNRIVMADQYPGNVAYISSVQLQNGGWVVIKNDNNGQPGDVIGMFVRDENGLDAFRGAGDGGQTPANLPPAKAGVDQNAGLRRFQIRAIASRTAAQNRQSYRHRLTLEGVAASSNLFLIFRISPNSLLS